MRTLLTTSNLIYIITSFRNIQNFILIEACNKHPNNNTLRKLDKRRNIY